MVPRSEHYTPFPPSALGHGHDVEFDQTEHSLAVILVWMNEHVGERGKDWWHPFKGIVVAREPAMAVLTKLTWG